MKCSDDLPYFAQSPPPPQSSPTSDDINISSSISISPTYTPKAHSSTSPPITVQEASSQDQSTSPSTSPPDSSSLDKSSLLSSSPPDVSTLWPRQVAEDAESIAESVYHQPPKAADRSAAYRLARRLFTLDGFKITDVAKHLCKRWVHIRFLLAAKQARKLFARAPVSSSPSVSVFDDSSNLRLHIGTLVEAAIHARTYVQVASSLSRIGLRACLLTLVTSLLIEIIHTTD